MTPVVFLLFAVTLPVGWAHVCVAPVGVRNLAKYSDISQSSVYGSGEFKAGPELAIDGNDDNEYRQHSCAHTQNDFEPWLLVDLKETFSIGVVVITNRKDCCRERLLGAEILVGNSKHGKYQLCGTITDVSNLTNAFCCNGLQGQYVKMHIPKRKEYLTVCEMKIYPHIEAPDTKPEDIPEERE